MRMRPSGKQEGVRTGQAYGLGMIRRMRSGVQSYEESDSEDDESGSGDDDTGSEDDELLSDAGTEARDASSSLRRELEVVAKKRRRGRRKGRKSRRLWRAIRRRQERRRRRLSMRTQKRYRKRKRKRWRRTVGKGQGLHRRASSPFPTTVEWHGASGREADGCGVREENLRAREVLAAAVREEGGCGANEGGFQPRVRLLLFRSTLQAVSAEWVSREIRRALAASLLTLLTLLLLLACFPPDTCSMFHDGIDQTVSCVDNFAPLYPDRVGTWYCCRRLLLYVGGGRRVIS